MKTFRVLLTFNSLWQNNIMQIMISGNSTTCRQINNHASMRDVQWKTQNCLMTFETIGIWPETVDGTDLGRDHLISLHCTLTSHSAYVATLTELHGVKIDGFLYPNFM